MQDRKAQIVSAKESERKEEEKIGFLQRFTLGNVLKIVYLLISVSFGYGLFGLIIYFMANKNYGLFFAICSVVSGSIHFFYEAYKVLNAEEIFIKNTIWKNKIKVKLIAKTKNLIIYIIKIMKKSKRNIINFMI